MLVTELLSNQGEKSINIYSIMVPLRKKYSSMVLQSSGELWKTAQGLVEALVFKVALFTKLAKNRNYMGGCQNYGPFWGNYNTAPNI